MHTLDIRQDPTVLLPISTDLLHQDNLSKALQKVTSDFQWSHVAEIPLYKTENDNFFGDLHRVDPAAVAVLYSDRKEKSLKKGHIGVSSDHLLPVSSQQEELEEEKQQQMQETMKKYDYESMLHVETEDNEPWLQ
jgi:hypothetical protein